MAISNRAFLIGLYEEYLSDGSFVAQQREKMLAEPLGEWGLLGSWEDRLEAYIDGLMVGGDLALEVCQQQAVAGDAGEFQIATRVFCRAARFDLIEKAVAEAEAVEGPKADALASGLVHERVAGVPDLVRRLIATTAALKPVLARVIGYQRLPLAALLQDDDLSSGHSLWALGRLRDRDFAVGALRLMKGDSPELKVQAALALARSRNTLDRRENWPYFAHGLMGDEGHFEAMISDLSADSTLGLGLLGLASAVPELIDRLPQPEAALALQLILGAGISAQQPIADEVLEEGERPTTELAWVTEPEVWRKWWSAHASQFRPDVSYRGGEPYSVSGLFDQLTDPRRTHVERYWAMEQLACRHEKALAFETDMPFAWQARVLAGKDAA